MLLLPVLGDHMLLLLLLLLAGTNTMFVIARLLLSCTRFVTAPVAMTIVSTAAAASGESAYSFSELASTANVDRAGRLAPPWAFTGTGGRVQWPVAGLT